MGSFYWIVLLAAIVCCLGVVYKRLHTTSLAEKKRIKKEKKFMRNSSKLAK